MAQSNRSPSVRICVFCILVVANSWLWMQAVHELGHVAGALASGGHVQCMVWNVLKISRTDVAPNPHPLLVCWMGPVVGCILPVLILYIGRRLPELVSTLHQAVLQFFAGFCCVANGAYISVGSIDRIGDAGVLLANGSPAWSLWLIGGFGMVAGFVLWHRLGRLSTLSGATITQRNLVIQTVLLFVTIWLQIIAFSEDQLPR